jgi:hypothetical protein
VVLYTCVVVLMGLSSCTVTLCDINFFATIFTLIFDSPAFWFHNFLINFICSFFFDGVYLRLQTCDLLFGYLNDFLENVGEVVGFCCNFTCVQVKPSVQLVWYFQ